MAEFHWKGRTADGQEAKGTFAGGSKEEVTAALQRQGILVQSIEEARADDAIEYDSRRGIYTVAGPPLRATEMLALQRAKGPRRVRGLLIALGFIAIGFGLGLLAPVLTCRCERGADGVVTCTLSESDLGVVPLRVQTLVDVRSSDIEVLRAGGESVREPSRGPTVHVPRVRFVFHGRDGTSIHASRWGDRALGRMRTDLESWWLENERGTFVRRSTEWETLLLALIPIGIGVLMLMLLVLSFSRGATEAIYAQAGARAEKLDARRSRRRSTHD